MLNDPDLGPIPPEFHAQMNALAGALDQKHHRMQKDAARYGAGMYNTETTTDLASLPVRDILLPDACLFLWVIAWDR